MQNKQPFRTEILPIHKTKQGGSRHHVAREFIEDREAARQAAEQAESDMRLLQELRELPPRRNIFKRRRQRRALASWLDRKGFTTADEAHEHLDSQKAEALTDTENIIHRLETIWLPQVRKVFSEYHPDDQELADQLFRSYDLPHDLIDSCDEQAAARGEQPNLLRWLSHAPTEQEPFGATNQQLEAALLWNAACTERMAADPSVAEHMVNDYLNRINACVAAGELDESWANPMPRISRIVIGDIMDARFLGYGGMTRRGHYNLEKGELALWPYELQNDEPLSHIVDHETGHALGGFNEQWLDEGFNEIFTRTTSGQDPFAESGIYDMNRTGIKRLLDAVHVTPKEISAFFIGQDRAANEVRLGNFLQQKYSGNDVLGTINAAYTESFDGNTLRLHDPNTEREAFFSAAFAASLVANFFEQAKTDPNQVVIRLDTMLEKSSALPAIAIRHVRDMYKKTAHQQASS